MSKMIQIRNVPDDVHRRFKMRAAEAGMTLSDYLLSELRVLAEQPTMAEWLEQVRQIHQGSEASLSDFDVPALIREGREERTDRIIAAALGEGEEPKRRGSR